MKKASVIFCILYILTLAVPASALAVDKKENNTNELVTIFSQDNENTSETESTSQNTADEQSETKTQQDEEAE